MRPALIRRIALVASMLSIALATSVRAKDGSEASDARDTNRTSAAKETSASAPKPISKRWIPGISAGLIVSGDHVDGAIDSMAGSTIGLGLSGAGSVATTVPRLQIGLDLSSPSLRRLPLGPRVVVFGGLQVMGPNEENQLAGTDGDVNLDTIAGEIANARPNAVTGLFPPPESFAGQGSSATSEYRPLSWYLGLGLVFEFPDRKDEDPALKLRPFASYVGEQIHLKGSVAEVTGRPPGTPYLVSEGLAAERDILHFVGPGLDVELVVASFANTTFSLFGTVSFLWNVGDSSYSFSDPNGIARYDFEVDDFQIRPGGGIRMAWRGGL